MGTRSCIMSVFCAKRRSSHTPGFGRDQFCTLALSPLNYPGCLDFSRLPSKRVHPYLQGHQAYSSRTLCRLQRKPGVAAICIHFGPTVNRSSRSAWVRCLMQTKGICRKKVLESSAKCISTGLNLHSMVITGGWGFPAGS